MQEDFWIYCAPISGGGLVTQLGMMCEIYEARKILNGGVLNGRKTYTPNLGLAASGGNVSLYIGEAGDWTTHGILRCAKQLDPKSFSRKWVPKDLSIVPNIVVGLCQGSLYRQGYGAGYLFSKLFNQETICRTEIWTGTYNSDLKSAQFFCNKNKYDSQVNEIFFNDEQSLFDSLRLKFMNGNIELISEVAIASASIPLIVPNQKIENVMYADGGCMYPSPLPVFSNEIYRIIINETSIPKSSKLIYKNNVIQEEILNSWQEEKNYTVYADGTYIPICGTFTPSMGHHKNLRLIYFMPYQADRINLKKETVIEKETDVIGQILHASMLRDRNTGIDILNRLSSDISHTFFPEMNYIKLGSLLCELSKFKHYMICFNPHGHPSISLTHFTSEDVMKRINETRNGYSVSVWYSKEKIK